MAVFSPAEVSLGVNDGGVIVAATAGRRLSAVDIGFQALTYKCVAVCGWLTGLAVARRHRRLYGLHTVFTIVDRHPQ